MLFLDDVNTVANIWRHFLLWICESIYKLIVYIYELFEVIGTSQILSGEVVDALYTRIGLILGIYMLFRIIISFVQMLINPDYISDKEKGVGKIVSKALLVIILLGITPFLFEKAIDIQNLIVGAKDGGNSNIIAKIVLPNQNLKLTRSVGASLSAYLFTSFYRYDEFGNPEERSCELLNKDSSGKYNMLFSYVYATNGAVAIGKECLDNKISNLRDDKKDLYEISFTWNGVFAIAVGAFVCYILIVYTLSAGARVIQFAFLRLIAPMAIIGYLSPKKDNMFNKWLKMCTTTYLDLFIRMGIIYFVVFIINNLISSNGLGIALIRDYDNMWIVNIVMILALLMFAKKAPDLLKELFPSSGAASLGFGIKSPKKLFGDMLGGDMMYKGLQSGAKRLHGATAVALRTSWGRTRDRIGEAWEDKGKENGMRNVGRIFVGAAGGLIAGAGRGLGTKDKAGRAAAVKTGRDVATQRLKRREAGYKLGDEIKDSAKGYFGIKTTASKKAAGLDNVIYGIHQNRQMQMESFNENVIKNAKNKKLAMELSSLSYDKENYSGMVNSEYKSTITEEKFKELLEDAFGRDDDGNLRVSPDVFKQHIETMTDLATAEAKAGKQKDALEKSAQKKDKSS